MKKFTVQITEDYSENKGNAVDCTSKTFDTIEEATGYYEEEILKIVDENGLSRLVELHESNELTEEEIEEGEEFDWFYKQLKSDYCKSEALPEDGVIVYFSHQTYMGYCYSISEVELVSNSRCSTYEDLPYSVDYTGRTHARVYSSIDDLVNDFENKYGTPFGKIKSGSSIVREFLSENNIEGYTTEEED